MNFEQINDEVAFLVDGLIVYKTKNIGIVLDKHLMAIKLHGQADTVYQLFEKIRKNILSFNHYPNHAKEQMLDDILFFSNSFSADELNGLMNSRNAVENFYQAELEKSLLASREIISFFQRAKFAD